MQGLPEQVVYHIDNCFVRLQHEGMFGLLIRIASELRLVRACRLIQFSLWPDIATIF